MAAYRCARAKVSCIQMLNRFRFWTCLANGPEQIDQIGRNYNIYVILVFRNLVNFLVRVRV